MKVMIDYFLQYLIGLSPTETKDSIKKVENIGIEQSQKYQNSKITYYEQRSPY